MISRSETRLPLRGTDLKLSALGFGTAGLGELFEPVSEADAQSTLSAAWDLGCRYYDTSPFYGHGQAEIRTGRGLYRHDRSDFVLSTKVGRLFRPPVDRVGFQSEGWIGGLPFEITYDYSYDGIMRSVEDSYLRLVLNRIDILFIHDLDTWFHPDPDIFATHRKQLLSSGWKALEELKNTGVVSAIGAGLNDRETMGWYLDNLDTDVFLLALRYSLLEHDVLLDEFPRCEKNNTAIIVGGAYNSGILATGAIAGAKYNYQSAPENILTRVSVIENLCRRYDVPLAAAALQFASAHPLVASVVVGALAPEHVAGNVAAFDMEIPPELWAELKAEDLLAQDAPTPQ